MDIDTVNEEEKSGIADEIANLFNIVSLIETNNEETANNNKNKINEKILEMEQNANKLKGLIDNLSNTIINKLRNEIEIDEKECNSIDNYKKEIEIYKNNGLTEDKKEQYNECKKKIFALQKNKNSRIQPIDFPNYPTLNYNHNKQSLIKQNMETREKGKS